MYETLIEVDLLQDNNHLQVEPSLQLMAQAPQQAEQKMREAESLLLLIDTSAFELKRPMNTVLNLSASLLSRTDVNSLLAQDLLKIVEQVEYMNEIVRGINRVTHYKPASRNGSGK